MTSTIYISDLERNGYAVTEPLLSPAECDAIVAKQWDFVEAVCGTKRGEARHKAWLHQIHGIVQHFGVGQSAASWEVRSNPRVIDTFARLYEHKGEVMPVDAPARGLLTSFDGFSIVRPTSQRYFRGEWLHVDQRSSKPDFACVQGLVNVGDDLTSEDHTFTCIPRSHRQFEAFFDAHPEAKASCAKSDWYKYTDEDLVFYEASPVKVPVPKGAMILWDSRTVHASSKSTAAQHKWRNVVYVCMTPKAWATPRSLKRKREHAVEGRTATHLAHDERLFPKNPRTYGKPQTSVYQKGAYGDFSTAPAVVRALAGF